MAKQLLILLLTGLLLIPSFSLSAAEVGKTEVNTLVITENIKSESPNPGVSFFSLILQTAKSSLRKVVRNLLLVNTNLKMAATFIISAIILRILLYTAFRNAGSFRIILDIGSYVLVLIGIIFFILWFLEAAGDF